MTAGTAPARAAAPPRPRSPAPPGLAAGRRGCGFFDVTCHITSAITGWFGGLIASAVNPLVNFIGSAALSTPQPSSIPSVNSLWGTSLAIADACYGLLVLIGGIIVMSHETLQPPTRPRRSPPGS